MNIVLYPNNEVNIRIPPVAATRLAERVSPFLGVVPAPSLTIAEKLRSEGATKEVPPKKTGAARPGYGSLPKGSEFSRRAQRLIVRTGALLGTGGYDNPVLFLTGTLPGSTVEALRALAENCSWVVHELLTHLPRVAGCLASQCRWIWCWEYQKRGALHWHCVIKLPDRIARDKILSGFTTLWNRVLLGVANRSNIDIFARKEGGTWANNPGVWQSKAEKLVKRADRYLAKYLSKTTSKGQNSVFPPTRWYGISRALHKDFRESVQIVQTHASNEVRHKLTDLDLDFLVQVEALSYSFSGYSDKVGTGYNFVVYFEDSSMDEARRIFGNLLQTNEYLLVYAEPSPIGQSYPALLAVQERPDLWERYQNDLGGYYRSLLHRWLDEDATVPEEELFWLEYYARRLLFVVGLGYKGQPPARSRAGLPSRSTVTLEPPTPPVEGFDQPSLFP